MRFKLGVLWLIIVSVFSCSSDDNNDNTGGTNPAKVFRFDIDGVTQTYTTVFADLYNDGKELLILGIDGGKTLTLKIGEVTSSTTVSVGNYTIGNSSGDLNENIIYREGASNVPYELYAPGVAYACDVLSDSVVGAINLTNFNTTNNLVSGTFNGSLFILNTDGTTSELEVTNGVFENISFVDRTKEVDADMVTAKVNNLNYVSNSAIGKRTATGGDTIKLTAFDTNFGRLDIIFPSDVIVGDTYTFDNVDFGVLFFNFLTRLPSEDYGTATLTITAHDTEANYIEGQFYNENASDTVVEGSFKSFYEDLVE